MNPPPGPAEAAQHRAHWKGNLHLIGALLLLWVAGGFVVPYLARSLNFSFFGWPFSFWVGAQGAPLLFLLIVAFYARRMKRLDGDHGLQEDE